MAEKILWYFKGKIYLKPHGLQWGGRVAAKASSSQPKYISKVTNL